MKKKLYLVILILLVAGGATIIFQSGKVKPTAEHAEELYGKQAETHLLNAPTAPTHQSTPPLAPTSKDNDQISPVMDNPDKMKTAIQRSSKEELAFGEQNYRLLTQLKASDQPLADDQLQLVSKWHHYYIYQFKQETKGMPKLEDHEMAVLLNSKNGQLALMLQRYNIRYHRQTELENIEKSYQIERHYIRNDIRFASYRPMYNKDFMKIYYLMLNDPRIADISLEIIENPLVTK